jgi:hypothetical protein
VRVETKAGGDGVLCWNVEPIRAYAQQVNEQETRLARDNPNLVVKPGLLKCYGCEVMEYDYGVRCTAELKRTLYAIEGEIEPRPEDAKRSLAEVPGLLTRAPDDIAAAAAERAPADLPDTQPSRARFRLFGR